MNTFSFLPEENDNYEIKNDNELRNKKKKLQKKIKRYQDNPTDDLLREINILKIDIREYEESKQTYIPKKKKKKIEEKNLDSEDFLDQEYNKNKEKNKRRYQEQKEKEKNEKKRKEEQRQENLKKREERRQEQQKQREQEYFKRQKKKEQEYFEQQKRREEKQKKEYESISKGKIFQDCGISDIPSDLSQLYDNYDKKKYKELTLKYHPDKSKYSDGYFKALNAIKEKYNPTISEQDETWVK